METDSGQAVSASLVERRGHSELAVSIEGAARLYIFTSEICEVGQHLGIGHTGRKVLQNIVNRDTHASDAGLAATLAGLSRNNVIVVLWHLGAPSVCVLLPNIARTPSRIYSLLAAGPVQKAGLDTRVAPCYHITRTLI